MTRRLFILGLGYSGLEIARQAQAAGWTVAGSATTVEKAAELAGRGIEAALLDPSGGTLARATHLLVTVPPAESGDPVLPWCASALARGTARPLRLGYLSTTGVYGDRGGGWVDESTEPRPGQTRSRRRLEAEQGWQALGRCHGIPVDIFRLPGIYGPGRSALDQVREGRARRIDKPGQVFSRIHVEDLARTVLAAMVQPAVLSGRIYNVADDEPASQADVVAFACELLGRPPPPVVSYEQAAAGMSEMARSFHAENRRVCNARIKRELGVTLRYPTYREGLRALLPPRGG